MSEDQNEQKRLEDLRRKNPAAFMPPPPPVEDETKELSPVPIAHENDVELEGIVGGNGHHSAHVDPMADYVEQEVPDAPVLEKLESAVEEIIDENPVIYTFERWDEGPLAKAVFSVPLAGRVAQAGYNTLDKYVLRLRKGRERIIRETDLHKIRKNRYNAAWFVSHLSKTKGFGQRLGFWDALKLIRYRPTDSIEVDENGQENKVREWETYLMLEDALGKSNDVGNWEGTIFSNDENHVWRKRWLLSPSKYKSPMVSMDHLIRNVLAEYQKDPVNNKALTQWSFNTRTKEKTRNPLKLGSRAAYGLASFPIRRPIATAEAAAATWFFLFGPGVPVASQVAETINEAAGKEAGVQDYADDGKHNDSKTPSIMDIAGRAAGDLAWEAGVEDAAIFARRNIQRPAYRIIFQSTEAPGSLAGQVIPQEFHEWFQENSLYMRLLREGADFSQTGHGYPGINLLVAIDSQEWYNNPQMSTDENVQDAIEGIQSIHGTVRTEMQRVYDRESDEVRDDLREWEENNRPAEPEYRRVDRELAQAQADYDAAVEAERNASTMFERATLQRHTENMRDRRDRLQNRRNGMNADTQNREYEQAMGSFNAQRTRWLAEGHRVGSTNLDRDAYVNQQEEDETVEHLVQNLAQFSIQVIDVADIPEVDGDLAQFMGNDNSSQEDNLRQMREQHPLRKVEGQDIYVRTIPFTYFAHWTERNAEGTELVPVQDIRTPISARDFRAAAAELAVEEFNETEKVAFITQLEAEYYRDHVQNMIDGTNGQEQVAVYIVPSEEAKVACREQLDSIVEGLNGQSLDEAAYRLAMARELRTTAEGNLRVLDGYTEENGVLRLLTRTYTEEDERGASHFADEQIDIIDYSTVRETLAPSQVFVEYESLDPNSRVEYLSWVTGNMDAPEGVEVTPRIDHDIYLVTADQRAEVERKRDALLNAETFEARAAAERDLSDYIGDLAQLEVQGEGRDATYKVNNGSALMGEDAEELISITNDPLNPEQSVVFNRHRDAESANIIPEDYYWIVGLALAGLSFGAARTLHKFVDASTMYTLHPILKL